MDGSPIFFSSFDVTDQVFLRTHHVVGIVNLKPIVPLHVLLIPPAPSITRLSSLPISSLAPFLRAIQLVVTTLEQLTGATSCNVAIQDGKEAGQSVEHLHVHILPRKSTDRYAGSDLIYDHLESFGFNLASSLSRQQARLDSLPVTSTSFSREQQRIKPDAEEDRKARSKEEMKAEADWLTNAFRDVDFSV